MMKRQRPSSSPRQGSSIEQSSKKTKKSATTQDERNKDRNWKQWKQQQIHDYNTHQFLDSSATVHAGLFGARRLPEIKSLWRHVVLNNESSLEHKSQSDHTAIRQVGESGGGKISSRHLRRRTGSHKRRRRHRFPRGAELSSNTDDIDEVSDIPLSSSQQRQQQKGRSTTKVQQKCRRARRKPSLLKQAHSNWWTQRQRQQITAHENVQHNWLPTHLWHAKRFHMSSHPIFSWSIPLLHTNRGSRASLRLATSQTNPKCTIQDASWEIDGCAIVLRASQIGNTSSTVDQVAKQLVSMLGKITDMDLGDGSITSGQRSAEGLIHEIDSFPAGVLGPGTFMFKPPNNSKVCTLSIFVHPAITLKVRTIIATLVANNVSGIDIEVSTEPYSLLRVRGTSSTTTISDVLSFSWKDVLPQDMDLDAVGHGALFKVQNSHQIILKSHQPNQHHSHLPQNAACSGWDILCHPSIVNDFFQSFVREGGACAIGLLENARTQLEASPPLPIFPRDYPDSAEGQTYWEGNSKDWKLIRSCFEGSWGRNNKLLRRNQTEDCRKAFTEEAETSELVMSSPNKSLYINWSTLVSPSDDQSVIVVRGSFGVPFLQLLHGCGRLLHLNKDDDSSNRQKRRPRRAVRPSNVAVHAPPLSKVEKEMHSKLCQQLNASLSLPALLRCEIFFEGKGSPLVGDAIYSFPSRDKSSKNLGLVTAGCFSPTRGRSYGVAFVSAAMFIDALDGTEHGMIKDQKMFLEVAVAKGLSSPMHMRRRALLSLLL